tara:strand:- start:1891 stop:2811 length:921 start_codon:yes stop_codon:yes gene_type:complete
MSVLDRFKDTEKYPRQMRELGMLIILNRRKDPGIFLKEKDSDRCGWFGRPSQFPDAAHTEEELGTDGELHAGILFKTPRLIIVRGGYKDDPTFVENSAERGAIEGLYTDVNHLWDTWKEKHPDKNPPYRRRRLVLCYLVDEDGVPTHKKPLILSIHGGASKLLCQRYAQFLEQLETAYADYTGDKASQGFGEKMASSVIWTPTFGSEKYGEVRKSDIAVAQSWELPNKKNILDFWPKKAADIDHIEDVYESCPPEVYASKYFKQCESEIGINALKPGVDITNCALPAGDSILGARNEDGALAGGLK